MKVNKRVLQAVALVMGVCMLCFAAQPKETQIVQIEEEPCALSNGTLVVENAEDKRVIPDIYNTGCKGVLAKVEVGDKVNGISFKSANDGARNVLDLAYENPDVTGTITFENCDFSGCSLWAYNEGHVDRNVKVVFNNCKFSSVLVGKESGKVSYEFNDCSFHYFNGSNSVFNRCQFGHSFSDGIVAFQNVEVNDCFFLDMTGETPTTRAEHTDGTQIYGLDGLDVKNVHFTNCRFEVPPLSVEGSAAAINACIMLQLEFSNAQNVSFTDCIVNGGGYSIYAWNKNTGYTFKDVRFSGIRSGCAKAFGTLYPVVDSSIRMEDISETDSLYVASVWKESGNTHFSVSNDTNLERQLLIYTDKGTYEYTIPACPKGSQMNSSMVYEDMPFDLDIVVPQDCSYAICYDNTYAGNAKQIRFVNWSNENVCLSEEDINALTGKADEVLLSGTCGGDVTFSLTCDGILLLSGTGSTDNYHSAKLPPWSEYNGYIRQIRIEEGIEKIGEQLFKNCTAVTNVVLPESLTSIGKYAFSGCTCLTAIRIPGSVTTIGDFAFSQTLLQEIRYGGSDWSAITLGGGNAGLIDILVYEVNTPKEEVIIMQGKCGKDVQYTLSEDGILRLTGTGETYNYHSGKTAPWYVNRQMITTVIVEEGVERLGHQLFAKCGQLVEVDLPEGLKIISDNCFISCSRLREVEIPRTVEEIHKFAFYGVDLDRTIYSGTQLEWDAKKISGKNESLVINLIFQ